MAYFVQNAHYDCVLASVSLILLKLVWFTFDLGGLLRKLYRAAERNFILTFSRWMPVINQWYGEILCDIYSNQSIGQYLSVHKDSSPTNRRFEEAFVGDCPKMMKFKAL
ncbi:hypothetical protein AVEN_74120-1 [Araneus ventricosus]|uniref:Uncharacterized protein n=1 Tax=Araneus ventricosus TaxID=182803 RepID=A0A4Y2WKY6_ARAVE|nr:hypothetical protein AVEN_74120-1 [Araneus ventricosus]